MKLLIVFLMTAAMLLMAAACGGGPEDRPETPRLISLSPHITEILYKLGADSLIIAVTDYCRYPQEAAGRERIGGLIDPNIEKIVVLKPTHLFGVPAHAELDQKLGQFGLRIQMYPNETWHDMLNTIDSVATKIGLKTRGKELIRNLEASLDSVKQPAGEAGPGVLLLIGHEKGSLRNATAAGPNTFIDEMLKVAGGRNIFSDLGMRYGTVSIEAMLSRGPEVIIDLTMEDEHAVRRIAADDTWSVLSATPAVRRDQIYRISGSHTLIPGPRMLWLAQDFRAVLEEAGNSRQ